MCKLLLNNFYISKIPENAGRRCLTDAILARLKV